MNRKRGANQLSDTFETLSEKEITQLKRQSPWFNNSEYMDGQALNELAEKIGSKVGRRVQLTPQSTTKAYHEVADPLAQCLDIGIFYAEIKTRCEKGHKVPLLHQCGNKNRGDYKRLYQWHKFSDTTETFIKPIQYYVLTKKRIAPRTTMDTHSPFATLVTPNPLAINNKELLSAVQDKLIESHQTPLSLTTHELVEPLERVLDANLARVIIVREMAFFLFEWSDPMPFVFIMAFTFYFSDTEAERFARRTIVTLHRKDIMTFDDDEEEEEEGTAMKTEQPGFHLLDQEDEEEEAEVLEISKMQRIASTDLDKERELQPFIQSVKASRISYLTSAYMKRD